MQACREKHTCCAQQVPSGALGGGYAQAATRALGSMLAEHLRSVLSLSAPALNWPEPDPECQMLDPTP